MNPEAQEKLEAILAKGDLEITKEDLSFIKARSSYLNDEQINRFFPSSHEETLKLMSRSEIDKILSDLGLEPKNYQNKSMAIDAIVSLEGSDSK